MISAQTPTPARTPASSTPLYRAGSLAYTKAGLVKVFTWLLAAEVVFTLIDMLEPKILPVLLQAHGATDRQIGIIIGSINAALQLLIMPPIGYYSDRLRTRWGRRIPLLFWVTPFVTLFLALTPFAPEITAWLMRIPWIAHAFGQFSIAPVVLCFGLLVFLYRTVQTVTNTAFFGLLRDVVPVTHMGRFLALFRVVGAGGTFIITYWLLGHADTQSKPIFIGVAALNLVGFLLICRFVREGDYPPVVEKALRDPRAGVGRRFFRATRVFIAESYSHPIYIWLYLLRVCLYGALLGLSGFVIFFPRDELGLSLVEVGKLLSWPSLAWLFVAYPVGRLIDRTGAMRVLWHSLLVITLGYVATFLFVVGPKTFFLSSLVTGVAFWIVMLAQLKLTQEIFHPQRYSQLAGAGTIVQSLLIAVFISPLAGWALDALKGWRYTAEFPGIGPVIFGPYRLVNLMLGALYGLGLLSLFKIRQHWKRLGGPENYEAPL
ncbi:MAG TPA: MFS transporter [Opitutaceae bacterium]|nr:MFS transporter [Opitutaceae bacterium]